jgi:hypothetical protein
MGLSKKETRQNTKNRNLLIRPSSQIKSNGYQYYFNVIVCSNATFLHDCTKTTELQKGLMSSIKGTKKTPRAKSMTSPPRLVRFMTWCLLQI